MTVLNHLNSIQPDHTEITLQRIWYLSDLSPYTARFEFKMLCSKWSLWYPICHIWGRKINSGNTKLFCL